MAPSRRTPKPKAADEVARTIRIYEWLCGELANDTIPTFLDGASSHATITAAVIQSKSAILNVAERIAARTED
jgi:hypothetical protein